MLMRPTRVAAVICHALSPELSHDAYGFTASFLRRPLGNISCFPWPGFGHVSRLLRREVGPAAGAHGHFGGVSVGPLIEPTGDLFREDTHCPPGPGRQDELVQRVAAASPRTVVVVNAGMPVLMPWAGQVGAVIYAWLPGQAIGEALADVLLGHAEPGRRLPSPCPRPG